MTSKFSSGRNEGSLRAVIHQLTSERPKISVRTLAEAFATTHWPVHECVVCGGDSVVVGILENKTLGVIQAYGWCDQKSCQRDMVETAPGLTAKLDP